MDELKLLYRAYVTDSLSSGRMEEDKVGGLISISFIPSALQVFWNSHFLLVCHFGGKFEFLSALAHAFVELSAWTGSYRHILLFSYPASICNSGVGRKIMGILVDLFFQWKMACPHPLCL